MAIDWMAVSDRLNTLIRLSTQEDVTRTAAKLGVKSYQLRETIDRTSRISTLKVAAAIARVYGLDPSWILTGAFSETTLRVAVRGNAEEIEALMKRLVVGETIPALPPSEEQRTLASI